MTNQDHVRRVALAALLVTLGLTSAHANTFVVQGTFAAEAGLPSGSLSGTIDINGGVITAASLSAPGIASPLTVVDGSTEAGTFCLHVAVNGTCLQLTDIWNIRVTNGSFTNLDEIGITFEVFPGRSLIGFQQGLILDGWSANDSYDPITTDSIVTYFGIGLSGTICPFTGCAPFQSQVVDVASVPAPVIGAGLPGLMLACAGLFGWRRRRRASCKG